MWLYRPKATFTAVGNLDPLTVTPSRWDPPPLVGVIAAVSVVIASFAPAIANPNVDTIALTTYLGFGIGGVWIVTAIAVVVLVVLVAGATGRTDPALAAGVGLGGGFVMVIAATIWALSVEESVAVELVADDWIRWHRFAVVAIASVVPAASVWWSWRLGLLGSPKP